MDYFLYQVALEQLHSCKTAKSLEELVRKWEGEVDSISLYNSSIDYNNLKFKYKLFVLSLNLFTTKYKKALPDFIYKTQINLQREVITRLSYEPYLTPLLNSDEFIDFFEFDSVVETPSSYGCFLTVLHNILLDKHVHFKFKFNQSLSTFDSYSASEINTPIKKYLYALRLKQTLSPNNPSTVLDQHLAETLGAISKHTDVSNFILLLQQHIEALQTYQSTYGVLVNE